MTFTLEEIRRAGIPESWACIDCGMDTAPGCSSAAQTVQEFASGRGGAQIFDEQTEVYVVKPAARMNYTEGCLCIGCLERRLGRRLRPKDFSADAVNATPGTDRLLSRRMGMPLDEVAA